jgi:hypothetical protein
MGVPVAHPGAASNQTEALERQISQLALWNQRLPSGKIPLQGVDSTTHLVDKQCLTSMLTQKRRSGKHGVKSLEKIVDLNIVRVYIHESHPYRADCDFLRSFVPMDHFPHHTYESRLAP